VLDFLKLKFDDEGDLNSPLRVNAHGIIINRNKFLRNIYVEWYEKLKQLSGYGEQGFYVELGSGAGFIKQVMPNVVTSDIMNTENADMVFSASNMPFENSSVDGILMIDVFHHLPDSKLFLTEAQRVLKTGGVVVMSEPWNCLWGSFIYKNFHHELFDPERNWKFDSVGPMSGANGALPWIVFERDRELFDKEFPQMKVESIELHTPFRYLMSGGFSYRQLVPSFLFKAATLADKVFSRTGTAMFAYIVVRKTDINTTES